MDKEKEKAEVMRTLNITENDLLSQQGDVTAKLFCAVILNKTGTLVTSKILTEFITLRDKLYPEPEREEGIQSLKQKCPVGLHEIKANVRPGDTKIEKGSFKDVTIWYDAVKATYKYICEKMGYEVWC